MDGLTRRGEFADVSFSVRAGEIVGLAGLVGSGRSETAGDHLRRAPAAAGTVTVDGRPAAAGHRCGRRSGPGMGLAPEERKSQALLLGEPVYRNVTLCHLRPVRPRRLHRLPAGSWPPRRTVAERLDAAAAATSRRPVRTLSGGNQQKVVLGALAARRHPAAAARRADPRRRRRRPGRALPGDPRAGRPAASACCWSPARCPRCSGWPTGCWSMREGRVVHEAGRRDSTSTPCSTSSWRARRCAA